MSKAFVRDSDDVPDLPIPPRPSSLLPPGTKNYLTPVGAKRLRGELARLVESKHVQLAAPSPDDDDDAKRQLQMLDQQIFQLQKGLQAAEIVEPPAAGEDRVQFGATVTVRDGGGAESRYRIVGVDEADAERGWVSWQSPIARVLINARVGDRVPFKFPKGDTRLEIVAIAYES